jgi:hypothetical protein
VMIVLGFISPGQVATAFATSLVNVMREEPRVSGYLSYVSGPRIASARCDVVRTFLDMESKPEWLLMLDSDMSFDSDICERFLEAAHEKLRPVVGGLCFGGGRVGVPFPTLYRLSDPAKRKGKLTDIIEDYPKDALCKVDATGAACLFMHRELLVQMQDKFSRMPDGHANPHPWFAESVYGGHEYGEDWTFCMRLKQMKVPLYVHTGIKLGHVKTQLYNEEFYNKHRRTNG